MFPCDCFFCGFISILQKLTVIWIHIQQINIHASTILNKLVLKFPLLQQIGIRALGSLFEVEIVHQIYLVVLFLVHWGFFFGMATEALSATRFEIEKFNGKNDFSLWRVKMRALLL